MALVNLAWFSAGENALVVTDRAIHHRKLGTEAHIPFDELAATKVKLIGNVITVGVNHSLGVGGTAAPLGTVEAMLKAVVKVCEARQREPQGAIGRGVDGAG